MGCKRECFYEMGNICCIECSRYLNGDCADYCDQLDAYTFTVNCPDYVKEEKTMDRTQILDVVLDTEFWRKWNSSDGKEFRKAIIDLMEETKTGGKVMDNYLVLNGKRIDLTEEQVKTLVGEEKKDDPFRKPRHNDTYWHIEVDGEVIPDCWDDISLDKDCYKCGNCCLDEEIMKHRALEETLSRLLWRFSMQNDGDKFDWENENQPKYYIYYDHHEKRFFIDTNYCLGLLDTCYFAKEETARRAIDEIIIPFCKEHPELGYEVEEQIEIPPLDINDAEDLDDEYEIKMED